MTREPAVPNEALVEKSFWTDFAPHLSISDIPWSPDITPIPGPSPVSGFGDRGFISIPEVIPAHLTTALASCLDALTEAWLPTPFLFMYDEAWQVYQHLDRLVEQLMGPGYLLGGDLWAWSLESADGAHGWKPHRDSMFKVPDRGTDGEPNYASLWVSISDASQNNGCIYVVPRQDPPIELGSPDLEKHAVALEAPAGSLLGWAPDVVHWSGRVAGPDVVGRKSLSVFAQRNDIPVLAQDMLSVGEPVPFDYRLGMVCRQLLRYIDSSLHPDLHELASWHDLASQQEKRFGRFVALLSEVNGRRPEDFL